MSIGFDGKQGTVIVSDTDWIVIGGIIAGSDTGSTGTVHVSNHGTVRCQQAIIGTNGTGRATVTGAGSRWNVAPAAGEVSDAVIVGTQLHGLLSDGQLSVLAGAVFESAGVVTVGGTMVGSTLDSGLGKILVYGQGSSGTKMAANSLRIGPKGIGKVTLKNSAVFRVGDGTGFVEIGGGPLSDGALIFGDGETAGVLEAGTIALEGGLSRIIVDATTEVVLNERITGTGGINKSNIGLLKITDKVDPTVAINFFSGQLQFGDGVTNGEYDGIIDTPPSSQTIFYPAGVVESGVVMAGSGGFQKNGPGTYVIDKTQTYTGPTEVNGGTVRVESSSIPNTVRVKVDALSAGDPPAVLEVTGNYSTVNATQNTSTIGVTIGNSHEALLRVLNGGKVIGQIADAAVFSGAHATVLLDNGTWTTTDDLTLGRSGTATIIVQNGGDLEGKNVVLGGTTTGNASLTLTGPGSAAKAAGGNFTVGSSGTGVFNILDGAAATGGGFVAGGTGGRGTVLISGRGSVWNGGVSIGPASNSIGTITVADGGTLEQPGVNVRLGRNALGNGTLAIGAGGVPGILHAASIQCGGTSAAASGTGRLRFNHTGDLAFNLPVTGFGGSIVKDAGGTTNITSNGLTFTGSVTVNDGKLRITGPLPNVTAVTINAGGILCGSGAWCKTSAVTNIANGGTMDAGAGQKITLSGAVTNNGLIRLPGGTLNFQSAATFVNEGVIDLTGGGIFNPPPAFTNNGVILTAPPVKVLDFNITGSTFNLHAAVKGGLTYQLQRSLSLSSSWTPRGSALTPAADTDLTFTDPTAPAGTSFYRVVLIP